MNESNMWKETDEEILQQIPEKLLKWYDQNARILPWRENPQPYRVWVSEIMLQQTRVEAVKPYFERFLKALPTVEDLAQAPEEQLLKLWEGLGYYNRVRNLQRGARAVMAEHGGVIPASFEALKKLPGIGDYTAGAIGSIAFQIPVPAGRPPTHGLHWAYRPSYSPALQGRCRFHPSFSQGPLKWPALCNPPHFCAPG